jgi:hypothetical protein
VRRPSWIDSNVSDPGITLLELFAFLAVALVLGRRLVARLRRGESPEGRRR